MYCRCQHVLCSYTLHTFYVLIGNTWTNGTEGGYGLYLKHTIHATCLEGVFRLEAFFVYFFVQLIFSLPPSCRFNRRNGCRRGNMYAPVCTITQYNTRLLSTLYVEIEGE